MFSRFIVLIICTILGQAILAQSVQNIRGRIMDVESLEPAVGAVIIIKGSDPLIGTSADLDGYFELQEIPTGRVSLAVSMIGYEDAHYDQLLLTSGKELYLEIKLVSAFEVLEDVVIKANAEDGRPLNEMATLSARSFSVEETQRYAASGFDPSRMAQAFAGVSLAGDNIENQISVRGNSPKGILWRLEGIEIPNPNHFGDLGSSGGGISMMSSSTLSNSDFYTGAFPAEFGNATSGVFDINFRNGNNQVREHSVMFGALGVELASEGYFNSKSNASYLVNYRYSTLALLSLVYTPFGDALPIYQDLSFKLNFPSTPIGSISIFGLGGDSSVDVAAQLDTAGVDDYNDLDTETFRQTQTMGVIGIKHVLRLNERAYLKTVAAQSLNRYTDETFENDLFNEDYYELFDLTDFTDDQASIHTRLNYKVDQRNTIRTGLIASLRSFSLKYDNQDLDTGIWTNYINTEGSSTQYEHYTQWKHRVDERWTTNLGYHLTSLPFNNTYSIEPRAALTRSHKHNGQLSLAIGLHSKPEHISTFYLDRVDQGNMSTESKNLDLEIPKSFHTVLGYSRGLGDKWRGNAEVYFQYQFDQVVEAEEGSNFATINATDIWDIVDRAQLSSQGKGRNYGLDLSLSRPFRDGMYLMASSSLYKSEYQTYDGDWFNTRFNGDYIANILFGKEYILKKPNRTFGFNLKASLSGGLRETPVDVEASEQAQETVRIYDQSFTQHVGSYYRFDCGISYKVNKNRLTHTILLDVQNVTNRLNVQGSFYDIDDQEVKTFYQTGLFPFINYRVEFQGKRKVRKPL